ncbi:hypothetical protein [Nocardia sp. NPDC019395]|uniref:hypothetical protein n=1 Tax=Nocardia sp. NPDC019395 TaxID=3154686 RepID=UPI0034098C5A
MRDSAAAEQQSIPGAREGPDHHRRAPGVPHRGKGGREQSTGDHPGGRGGQHGADLYGAGRRTTEPACHHREDGGSDRAVQQMTHQAGQQIPRIRDRPSHRITQ